MQTATTRFQKDNSLEDEVRAMLFEDPNLSVDTVARRLAEKYRHHGLVKAQISRIRLEVRCTLDKAMTIAAPPTMRRRLEAVPETSPFNQIRWGINHERKAPVAEQQEDDMQDEQIPSNEIGSTHRERIAYLEEYALQNLNATIAQARQALKAKFGQAVGTKTISNTLALVRDYAEPRKPTQLELPAVKSRSKSVADIVNDMRNAGLKQITILQDGTWVVNGG